MDLNKSKMSYTASEYVRFALDRKKKCLKQYQLDTFDRVLKCRDCNQIKNWQLEFNSAPKNIKDDIKPETILCRKF